MRPVTGLWGVILASLAAGVQSAAQAGPTFNRDVAPIVWDRCGTCHRPGGAGPFALIDYSDVAKRSDLIGDVIRSRYMPPWPPQPGGAPFEGERRMSDAEIATLLEWIEDGRPEGRNEDLPPAPTWPSGWTLGRPDLVVEMEEPFAVPAEGPDVFRSFVLKIPIDRTRHVRGFEFRPGNAPIVHHARILLDAKGVARSRDEHEPGPGFSEGMAVGEVFDPEGHWIGWTPGKQPTLLESDLAWRIDPGTDLVLELHMLPTGRPERIQSALGLHFTGETPKRTPFILRLGRNDIDIPAGASNYVIEDSYRTPVAIDVLNVYAHAHYLGKSVRGWAVLPGGEERQLLRIDDWSFDWQDEYRYLEPVRLPRGSRIHMRFTYDNSARNPRNASDPPQRVTYGWKTFEEMGDLWFQVLAASDGDREILARNFHRKERLAQIAGLEKQLEIAPGDLGKRKDLGYLNFQAGRFPEAIREFERVIERDPRSVFSWHNLGLSWNLLGETDKAAVAYREAIEADPGHAPSLSNLAVVLANAGRAGEAEQSLRQAIRAQPRYVEAYGNLGAVLVSLGRFEEAIAIYRRAVEIAPDYGPVHYNLAGLYRDAGQLEAARRHYRAAKESDYERAAALAGKALDEMPPATTR
ncbi:MAG: tetratricopeptide repeat protein [Bryobacterales bacterium]|nr:tetratricopeptide repeat protein [Bryobacterales bacterium]